MKIEGPPVGSGAAVSWVRCGRLNADLIGGPIEVDVVSSSEACVVGNRAAGSPSECVCQQRHGNRTGNVSPSAEGTGSGPLS